MVYLLFYSRTENRHSMENASPSKDREAQQNHIKNMDSVRSSAGGFTLCLTAPAVLGIQYLGIISRDMINVKVKSPFFYKMQLVGQLSYVQLNARAHGRSQSQALNVRALNGAGLRLHDCINKRLEVVG